jgi:hypothetical protein
VVGAKMTKDIKGIALDRCEENASSEVILLGAIL